MDMLFKNYNMCYEGDRLEQKEKNWGNTHDRKVMKIFESLFDILFPNMENEEKEAKRKQGGRWRWREGTRKREQCG